MARKKSFEASCHGTEIGKRIPRALSLKGIALGLEGKVSDRCRREGRDDQRDEERGGEKKGRQGRGGKGRGEERRAGERWRGKGRAGFLC